MPDQLAWRQKFAVLVPSTNTIVQPEFDAMRPHGVTNHISRIRIPNMALANDEDFQELIRLIDAAQMEALDSAMSCLPDRIVLGISAESFWGGLESASDLKRRLETHTGLPVTTGSDAAQAALGCYAVRRIGVVTPYQPVGDRNVARFFSECGFEVKNLIGLKCASPIDIARVPESRLAEAIRAVDGPDVDAVIQVGTNLAMARLAGFAETWIGKPVLAINTAIFWHALRDSGIEDRIDGWGSLLLRH